MEALTPGELSQFNLNTSAYRSRAATLVSQHGESERQDHENGQLPSTQRVGKAGKWVSKRAGALAEVVVVGVSLLTGQASKNAARSAPPAPGMSYAQAVNANLTTRDPGRIPHNLQSFGKDAPTGVISMAAQRPDAPDYAGDVIKQADTLADLGQAIQDGTEEVLKSTAQQPKHQRQTDQRAIYSTSK